MDRAQTSNRGGASALPPVVMDRRAAADDTDTATRQTVELMAEYIRAAAKDPFVIACAQNAVSRFGLASGDANSKAWAVFWWVKHAVKFRSDEATMFRIGEPNQQDLLISPSVLLRLKDPAEDCDGFTMTVAAMLTALDVPVVVVTVAVDPSDPSRWSHVFPMAVIDGRPMPLDASHGVGPGWMVPDRAITRYQAYGLDAKPVDIRPRRSTLHGYVSKRAPGLGAGPRRPRYIRRGMGDLCSEFGIGCDVTAPSPDYLPIPTASGSDGYLQWGSGAPAPSSSGGSGIWSFLTNLVNQGAGVAKVAVTPTSTFTYPGGATYSGPAGQYGGAPSSFSAISSGSLLPIVGIGLLAVLLLKGRK